jgi:NADH:ubiquinone oxidoreductase subunit 6 (subunit J)
METTVNQNQIVLKWTAINVITAIVITYIFQFANVDQASSIKYLGYIPFIIFLFLAQKEYKDQMAGYITFGQGFLTGFKVALFSGLILAVFTYIYFAFLSPQVLEKILTDSQQKMTDQGNLSSDQIDTSMEFLRKYIMIFSVIGVALMDTMIGVILALIGAAILKKEKPLFTTDEVDPTA